jgi:NAD(P)-dependent dehydrogenase (short-subunit alcohol dehydrogenase family)
MGGENAKAAIVVTGASSGIGRVVVKKAVGKGVQVFAGVRNERDAASLREEFAASVTPLVFDVTDEDEVAHAAALVRSQMGGQRLFGLVNNAGIALPGPLVYLATEVLKRQYAVNVFGVHTVTRAFVDMLGQDSTMSGPPGRIVMVSSAAGRNGAPFVGPCSSSKFALEGYSQSLRRELMLFGIDVIVVGPGAIATPIWDKAESYDMAGRFAQTPYRDALKVAVEIMRQGRHGLPAERVADCIWKGLSAPAPKVRYAMARRPIVDAIVSTFVSPRQLDRAMARRLGFPPPRR